MHSIYLRLLTLAILLCLSLVAWAGVDSKINYTDISVDIYTVNGKPTGSEDSIGVKHESGTLFKEQGFIPSNVSDSSLKVDAATLTAISGKPLVQLSSWITLNDAAKAAGHPDALEYFPRSSETYIIAGVPYVTVSVKGSSGGTGGGVVKGKPTVSISAAQANAAEGGFLPGRFLIEFDAPRAKKINVSYAISGTARNGKDYTKIKGKVSIPAGESSVAVDISPIDDLNKEPTEKVTLKLKSGGSYKVNKSQKTATVEITDND